MKRYPAAAAALRKDCLPLINAIIKRLLPAGSDPQDAKVRQHCGSTAGAIGIGLNLCLSGSKFIAGLLTGSIAVIADAVNNLSDAAASVVTLIGFRLAGQAADQEHPFGHGRIEYLTGLVVALAILLMGFEIGKSSVQKLLSPLPVDFSWLAIAILGAAIGVKLWMFLFNRALGRALGSAAMEATAADSLSDVVSTSVVLLSTLADRFLGLHIDALAGLLVAAFILKTGWSAAKETLDPLLGRAMDPALAQDIAQLVHSHPGILGIHDLVYHDYGPSRAMMSFHAEVPANGDLLEMHDLIDHIERELKHKHHIETVIHMDPVVCDDSTAALRQQIDALAQGVDPALTIHDFRITAGPLHTNVIFDVVVPHAFHLSDHQVQKALSEQVRALSDHYYAVIQVDHSFVDHTPPAPEG